MAERNLIQQAFDAFGKRAGMLKQSGTWYRATDDVTQAVNLQKSGLLLVNLELSEENPAA